MVLEMQQVGAFGGCVNDLGSGVQSPWPFELFVLVLKELPMKGCESVL